MKAGVGKTEISLSNSIFPTEHFQYIHDSLFSRAIIIEAEQKIVFLSLDMTSLQNYAVEAIKKKLFRSIQFHSIIFLLVLFIPFLLRIRVH